MPSWRDRLTDLITGGERELGRDDVIREVSDRIYAMKRFASRGVEAFPPEVLVRLTVGHGSVETVRRFVNEPDFDHEVAGRLLNRMTTPSADVLPIRRYEVVKGEANAIDVSEAEGDVAAVLRVVGGDCDGAVVTLAVGQGLVRLGRGAWHGPDERELNDVVLTEHEPWVSRRAALLRRTGALFELTSRDQGDCVVIVSPGGKRVRPTMTAAGRATVAVGDRIEFNDGKDRVIAVCVEIPARPEPDAPPVSPQPPPGPPEATLVPVEAPEGDEE